MDLKYHMGKVLKKKCPSLLLLMVWQGNQMKYIKSAWDNTKSWPKKYFDHALLK